MAPFAVPRLLGRRVEALSGRRGAFRLRTDRGDVVAARAVLIAAGAGAFGPNRPPLPGLDGFEASGAVQYWVRSRDAFRGRSVAIAGRRATARWRTGRCRSRRWRPGSG